MPSNENKESWVREKKKIGSSQNLPETLGILNISSSRSGMMKSRKCIIQVYKIIKVMDKASSDIFTILQNTRISIAN